MDSELSLIEISEADDSLLLQSIPITSDDVDTGAASLDKNYFPCSPLQLLDGSEPSLSSGVVDKENIGVNKFVTPNLGADSLQRKRKNRKCGYNLRKSLAWNRAFLTEEGVLDPTELSIISGNPNDVMRDKFAVIHEDVKELSHENSVSPSISENLPAFEKKLFQKLPRVVENEGQSAYRSSTNTHLTLAKPTRIPVSSVNRRVLAAQDVNSGRSKQTNGQTVVASSSLKRAASSNTANIGCKDLKKVSKSRTANPDLGLHLSTTNTMPSSGYIKQTQCVKPDIPAGRNVRMKRLSGNAAGPQRNVTGSTPTGIPLTDKSTTRQASRNMDNPQSRMNTLPVKNRLKPPIKTSSRNEVGSASKGVSLVENAELVKGKIQHLLVERAEPTGLRMPSPSISFFDQPRASALRRPIMPAQLCNAFPPVSSNMMDLQRIGCADTMMFAPVQKMIPTPDIKSETNVKWINLNAKTSEGCSLIPRQREDLDDACYNLKSFLQLDVKELSIRPKFSCLRKEACKNLREDINQSVCDVHLKDEIATYGNITTGCIGTVTDTKAREECTSMSCADHGAFSLPNPKYFSNPSSCLPSTGILNHSYCAYDDREVYQSQNNSFLGDCNQTFVNQYGSLSSPTEKTDVVIPTHLCGCEDDDGLDGLPKTGGQLDSEDEVNGSSSSSFKVEIVMASLAGDRCFIIADDVNGGSVEQLKDSSSNSEQPFFMTSCSDDLSIGSTGHKIPSEPAPASMDGDVGGGSNSFSAPSHMTSDKTGSFDSPLSEEDEQATSPCMGSGDAAANGKGKYEINLHKAGDILDSIATTILEEPTDVSADHIRTPQSISEPALLKEGAEDDQLTLNACCSAASQLQSIDGSINSNQTALLVQVDSSHLVGVHLDSSHIIHDNLYVESQLERAFDELATNASADGNITVATSICMETESETKREILDYATIDDSLSCEKGSLNVPDWVTFDELALVSVEYEALDCLHWPGNQQMSSPNVMLSDKPANEESPTETQPNMEKNSSSLVSNMEMNDEPVLVALGVPSLLEAEIGSPTHGSENRIEIPVAVSHLASSMRKVEDTGDDLAKCLSVDAPLQASASDDVEAHISSASNIVQEEPESSIKMGEPNDSTPPTDNLDNYHNQDHVVGKPPADSIPYSDEWLAAIEAAGEDILKMKSGAVQNSPPERSEPEPSPWSPVRRKNNQAIGPFDCTKFINAGVPLNTP